MDAPPAPPLEPFSPDDAVAPNPSAETRPATYLIEAGEPIAAATTAAVTRIKHNRKKKSVAINANSQASPSSSTASFSRSSSTQLKRRFRVLVRTPRFLVGPDRQLKNSDVEALALPLGVSMASIVAKVLERKDGAGEKMSVDHLSAICSLTIKQSLNNVFGDKFDGFVRNFQESFRYTLLNLRLVDELSQSFLTEHQKSQTKVTLCSEAIPPSSSNVQEDPAFNSSHGSCEIDSLLESTRINIRQSTSEVDEDQSLGRQLSLHHTQNERQLVCASSSKDMSSAINQLVFSTLEKSVVEQARSNDLMMRKLQLEERKLALKTDANFLERCKLSMGFSKASFKAGKFKTQLEDTKHAELLKNCIDCLVAGLVVMLACLAYGTYIYSYDRITEATSSCMPTMASKSWWMPKSMSSFSSGYQTLRCQVQVISRMLFGLILIFAIVYLLIHRSASTSTMPVTFIILLLGVFCGTSGKFCIDTLGGSGYHWFLFWEALCLLHFISNVWTSVLYNVLYGPIIVMEDVKNGTGYGYLVRRIFFYMVMLVFLPLLCGFVPFASIEEWRDHFSSLFVEKLF